MKGVKMTGDWTSLLASLPPGVLSGLSSRILTRIPRIQFGDILTKEEVDKLSQGKLFRICEWNPWCEYESISNTNLVFLAIQLTFDTSPFSFPAATSLTVFQSQILVNGLTDLFRSAAFASKRPAQLTKQLKETSADVPDEQLEVLAEVWAKEGAAVIRALKSQSASLTGGEVEVFLHLMMVY